MTISIKEDAKQRIEKVVAVYRNDNTRTNFTLETKPEHRAEAVYYWYAIIFIALCCERILNTEDSLIKLLCGCGGVAALLWYVYMLYSNSASRFKIKVWHNDHVSEADIFYLCENSGLKGLIRERVALGDPFTYTGLEADKYFWIGKIEGERLKAVRDELVKKIDAVEPHTPRQKPQDGL